jgi:hypothetical protein
MGLYEYWRDISPGTPFDTVTRYRFESDDDTYHTDSFNVPSGNLGPVHPPVGTVIHALCIGLDYKEYKGTGSSASVNIVLTEDDPGCCTLSGAAFTATKTNNTNLGTPNGTITVVSAGVEDIDDYEGSIDGGGSWISAVAGEIKFEDLPGGSYTVLIKASAGVCSITYVLSITDVITYPPLIVSENEKPDLYAPVFYPIELTYLLDNNDATVKQDGFGNYLEVGTDDAKDYLATLPIIRILDPDYGGTYQVTSVNDVDTPTKFYISDLTYTVDKAVLFVPFERQVFSVYAEKSFGVFQKLADISTYPDAEGEYRLRLEGFLQTAFPGDQPVSNGADPSLLRKYYVVPRDFDMEVAPTIFNAVYSAVPDLTSFLAELVPLGPLPINFINEVSGYGLPVIFSYIDLATSRVVNITSSNQTDVVSSLPVVYIPGLPLNQYDVTWTNPAGVIASLNTDPALPAWITILPSAGDQVKLHIDLTSGLGGDYDPLDYDSEDYLAGGANAIVGCYTYIFKDGVTPLFELIICAFPISKSTFACAAEHAYNIAWINREGGWSSYVFNGRKVLGRELGTVKTYKSKGVLKRSSVEDVYETVQVSMSTLNKKDMQFVSSMRSSIQAYLWSESTQQWSIPIIINDDAFTSYAEPFKQAEQNGVFTFKYAEEVRIQKQ